MRNLAETYLEFHSLLLKYLNSFYNLFELAFKKIRPILGTQGLPKQIGRLFLFLNYILVARFWNLDFRFFLNVLPSNNHTPPGKSTTKGSQNHQIAFFYSPFFPGFS
jgi:hypothetical protein